MLRQVLMNLVKNALEAKAQKMVIEKDNYSLYIGNDGPDVIYRYSFA